MFGIHLLRPPRIGCSCSNEAIRIIETLASYLNESIYLHPDISISRNP